MNKHFGFIVLLIAISVPMFGQCDGKSDFAKKLCEAQSGQLIDSTPNSDALTTGLGDTLHANTLPASFTPPGFVPLTKLDRANDGSFMLKAGFYEASVESFSLDAGNAGNRAGGYYPAPIKGKRAKLIADVLKNAELHPEASHAAIQQLLSGIIAGTDLNSMSAQAQQAAAKLLTKDEVAQLHTPGKAVQKHVVDWLNRQLSNNAQAQQAMTAAQNKENQLDQKYGISAAMGQGDSEPPTVGAQVNPIARGTWVMLDNGEDGGFYVRYLPQGTQVKLQIIVPDSAVQYSSVKPVGFDPTQYIAVYVGSPIQRLGISLRGIGKQ